MKKITYINYKGEKITRLCYRVYHYKEYAKLEWREMVGDKIHNLYEDVSYKNIIEEVNE